jgi:hypothetical protein
MVLSTLIKNITAQGRSYSRWFFIDIDKKHASTMALRFAWIFIDIDKKHASTMAI